jgi:hypothetical protein
MRCECSGSSLHPWDCPPKPRFDLDARLKTKEEQFTEAAFWRTDFASKCCLTMAIVVPGQDVRVSISIGDRGRP